MKFAVTAELSTLLRMVRMRNNISAKELAESIGKSPSYISKLEKGDVKSIKEEGLTEIFTVIFAGKDFYREILPGVVKVLLTFMEPGRLAGQVWLMQYDVVRRQIAVPKEMMEDVLSHLAEKGASVSDLAEVINANIDSEMSAAFLPNEMVSIDYEGSPRLLIRADLNRAELEQVLYGRKENVNYFTIYCIVHSMFRLMNFPGADKKLPPEDAAVLLRLAATYMERWGIHSLVGFSHMLSSEEFINRQTPLANDGMTIITSISKLFGEIAEHDALLTTRQLNTFYDTLNWDAAFAMKLVGIPFSDLDGLSYQNKKKLLQEIQEMVERYDQMSEFERKMERY